MARHKPLSSFRDHAENCRFQSASNRLGVNNIAESYDGAARETGFNPFDIPGGEADRWGPPSRKSKYEILKTAWITSGWATILELDRATLGDQRMPVVGTLPSTRLPASTPMKAAATADAPMTPMMITPKGSI